MAETELGSLEGGKQESSASTESKALRRTNGGTCSSPVVWALAIAAVASLVLMVVFIALYASFARLDPPPAPFITQPPLPPIDPKCTFQQNNQWQLDGLGNVTNVIYTTENSWAACQAQCCAKQCLSVQYQISTQSCAHIFVTQAQLLGIVTVRSLPASEADWVYAIRNPLRIRKRINDVSAQELFWVTEALRLLQTTYAGSIINTTLTMSNGFSVDISKYSMSMDTLYNLSWYEWITGYHGAMFFKSPCPQNDSLCDEDPGRGTGLCGGALFPVDGQETQGYCCPHNDVRFPLWHRLLMSTYELMGFGMLAEAYPDYQALFLQVGVPYWDWTNDPLPDILKPGNDMLCTNFADLPPGFPATPPACETANSTACCRRNWWSKARSLILVQGINQEYSCRNVNPGVVDVKSKPDDTDSFYNEILDAFQYNNYEQYDFQLEMPHNTIHNSFGTMNKRDQNGFLPYPNLRETDCACCTMPSKMSLADPAFWLHHSQIDRLHTAKQQLDLLVQGYVPLTQFASLPCTAEMIDQPMAPFHDPTLNPISLTQYYAFHITDVIDTYPLGYAFDNFNLGNRTMQQWMLELNKTHASEDYFIGVRWYTNAHSVIVSVLNTSGLVLSFDISGASDNSPNALWPTIVWKRSPLSATQLLTTPLHAQSNATYTSEIPPQTPSPYIKRREYTGGPGTWQDFIWVQWTGQPFHVPDASYAPIFIYKEKVLLQTWDCSGPAAQDTWYRRSGAALSDDVCDLDVNANWTKLNFSAPAAPGQACFSEELQSLPSFNSPFLTVRSRDNTTCRNGFRVQFLLQAYFLYNKQVVSWNYDARSTRGFSKPSNIQVLSKETLQIMWCDDWFGPNVSLPNSSYFFYTTDNATFQTCNLGSPQSNPLVTSSSFTVRYFASTTTKWIWLQNWNFLLPTSTLFIMAGGDCGGVACCQKGMKVGVQVLGP